MYHSLGIAGLHQNRRGLYGFGQATTEGPDALTTSNSDLSLSPEEYEYWYNYYSSMGELPAGLLSPIEYRQFANDVVTKVNVVTAGNATMNITPASYADAYNFIQQTGLGLLQAQWLAPDQYNLAYQSTANLDTIVPAPGGAGGGPPPLAVSDPVPSGPIVGGLADTVTGGIGGGVIVLAAIGIYLLMNMSKGRKDH